MVLVTIETRDIMKCASNISIYSLLTLCMGASFSACACACVCGLRRESSSIDVSHLCVGRRHSRTA